MTVALTISLLTLVYITSHNFQSNLQMQSVLCFEHPVFVSGQLHTSTIYFVQNFLCWFTEIQYTDFS